MRYKNNFIYYITLFACVLFILAGCASIFLKFDQRKDVRAFTAQMAKKYQFNQNELLDLFKQVTIQKSTLSNIQHPYEEKPWYVYQERLVTKQRTQDGLKYWKHHARALQYAQNTYGVPASIIVAIIGVESNYGKVNFKYRTFDALTTLSFDYPKRAKFFQQELEQYLLLTREHHLDPLAIFGSYAGAIGPAQFMPSTYRRFAVSYQTGGTADIINNNDDAIVSVANFLKQKGWQPNKIITVRAKTNSTKYQQLLTKPPRLTIAQFKTYGLIPPHIISNRAIALLVPLQKQQTTEYWLGFNNFMVLMKYNPNVNYAMAIYNLSKQLDRP